MLAKFVACPTQGALRRAVQVASREPKRREANEAVLDAFAAALRAPTGRIDAPGARGLPEDPRWLLEQVAGPLEGIAGYRRVYVQRALRFHPDEHRVGVDETTQRFAAKVWDVFEAGKELADFCLKLRPAA